MKTRNKGYRSEHELEGLLRSNGINARRIPLSGQAFHTGDLIMPILGKDVIAEVKAYRQNFFEYDLLSHSGIVFKRTTGVGLTRKGQKAKPWLVVIPFEMFVEVIKLWEKAKPFKWKDES